MGISAVSSERAQKHYSVSAVLFHCARRRASWGAVWVIGTPGDGLHPLLGLGSVVPPSQMATPREAHAWPFDGGGHPALRKVGETERGHLRDLSVPWPPSPDLHDGTMVIISPKVFPSDQAQRKTIVLMLLGVLYPKMGWVSFWGDSGVLPPRNRRDFILPNLRISYRSFQRRMAESGLNTKTEQSRFRNRS